MTTQKTIALKVTFLHRTYSKSYFGKLLTSKKSDSAYVYYGKTKKECLAQAYAANRTGVQWLQEFTAE
jgi:hypothetical protein